MEKPIWNRQKFDTQLSWQAFQDYLKLPVPRSTSALNAFYVEGPSTPRQKEATLRTWSAKHKWQERARSYDAEEGARLQEARLQAGVEIARSEIEEFSDTAKQLGKRQAAATLRILSLVEEKLESDELSLYELVEISKICKAMATVSGNPLDLWAIATGAKKAIDDSQN